MRTSYWDSISRPKLIAFLIGASALVALILSSPPIFVFLIDHANLLLHKACHTIVGLFSHRLEPYSGTIGQLVLPFALMLYFWFKRQPMLFAGSTLWFFANWLNVARYVADARTMALPLMGGDTHDWNTILGSWGLLQDDFRISAMLQFNAWIGIGAVCVWVCWRYRQNSRQRQNFWSDPFLSIKFATDPRFRH